MASMHRNHGLSSVISQLPPLAALEVFVIAARCGTFSGAAAALKVTQSAVSRRVQQLEQDLGSPLFVRHKLGLKLTPEGEVLLPVAEDAFARLTRVSDSLRAIGQVLTLRMPPTLAMRWFLPLLPSLRTQMPDVDVRITTDDSWEPNFGDNDVDAAIIYGRGGWPDLEAIRLMPERLTPVCAPGLAERLRAPADLAQERLLQCYPVQAWGRWLEGVGAGWISPQYGQTFDTLEMALSAATRGQGVALGDLNLLTESLNDRVLAAPFDHVLDQGVAYYLIYPVARAQMPKIRALREWLSACAAPTLQSGVNWATRS